MPTTNDTRSCYRSNFTWNLRVFLMRCRSPVSWLLNCLPCLHMERKTIHSDFRYYMHDGETTFSFELSGRLSDDAARQLEQAWRTASSVIGKRSLTVDVSYVSAIDPVGQDLLRDWHNQGARFVANSHEAKALIESITGQSLPEAPAQARHSTWLPFRIASYAAITLLLLVFPVTTSAI